MSLLHSIGWLVCVVYATVPLFWLMIHPRAERWREHPGSPYRVLLPVWLGMWVTFGGITAHWRQVALYSVGWGWIPSALLIAGGVVLYKLAGSGFSLRQLGGLPEILPRQREQRLVTTGIRSKVRHPVYLGHFCEMLGWSLGTGLAVCWGLTAFAVVTGALMIRQEDAELENRFGEQFQRYRSTVPAFLPWI